jgi:hypothetical protein
VPESAPMPDVHLYPAGDATGSSPTMARCSSGAVWILYLLRSRRMELTFVR